MAEAIKKAKESGKLPDVNIPEVPLEHPQVPSYGDYASSLPLRLGRLMRKSPVEIAETILFMLPTSPEISKASVAAPGFINFTLSDEWLTGQVDSIISDGDDYGRLQLGHGEKMQLEFVSGNPTGPLHVGHGRGAVLGSTLAEVLRLVGYDVKTEYYINDAGSQIANFGRSIYARYCQTLGVDKEMPEGGYFGDYVKDLAREIVADEGRLLLSLPDEEALARITEIAVRRMLDRIKSDLKLLGVEFDVWFSESTLYSSGQFDNVMKILGEKGYLISREGAIWFTSSSLGEDKDNVLIRSDGQPTYFASDIAYHYNKFVERGFDEVIDIWGADHQGHVSRMKAAVAALGIDPDRLTIIITQMVTLYRNNEIVRLSKRTGDIITLKELIDEVGADACRLFFLSRAADSQMDFDLELAKEQSSENPVYYIQYAHTRTCGVLRYAKGKGITFDDGDTSLLTSESELDLIKKMVLLPEVIEAAAKTLEPHHLVYYAIDLATVFHSFYKQCRIISEDSKLTKARLKLVTAAKIVLGKTLALMGLNAPETM
jgi:arginyl-tRNA synthetase